MDAPPMASLEPLLQTRPNAEVYRLASKTSEEDVPPRTPRITWFEDDQERATVIASVESLRGGATGIQELEDIPTWATDDNVRYIVDKEGVCTDLDRTTGPAVLWGYACLFVNTYFLAILPIVGYYIARCPDDETQFAKYPHWIVWVLFFLPFAGGVLTIQWKSMTFMLLPLRMFLQHKGTPETGKDLDLLGIPLSVLGGGRRAIRIWIVALFLVTLVNLLDMMTNALVIAKMYATQYCKSNDLVEPIWNTILEGSVFGPVVWLTGVPSYASVMVALYVIQLVVNLLFAICATMPLHQESCSPAIDASVGYKVIRSRGQDPAAYQTMINGEFDATTHACAMATLAEASRMEVVSSQHTKYTEVVKSAVLANAGLDEEEEMISYVDAAIGAFPRAVQRIAIKGLLQNAFQINIQIVMLGISIALNSNGFDPLIAVSVALTLIVMLMDAPDMVVALRYVGSVRSGLQSILGLEGIEEEALDGTPITTRTCLQGLANKIWWLRVTAALCVALAAYACMQFVIGALVCEDRVWDVGALFKGSLGCVDLALEFKSVPSNRSCTCKDTSCIFE